MRLLANGLSDSEIAESLVLTIGTVKWYNRQIYRKLDVPNRTQALIHAQRFGLLPGGSAVSPQPGQPQTELRHNLPAQLTTFIGRQTELTRLHQLSKTSRLLTLVGPPGTGKTRLSLQFATEALSIFRDGVFFVSLAPVRDPALVLNSIAQGLDVTEAGGVSLLNALKKFLSGKHMLLVLDNFEHVQPAAPLVSELLGVSPGLSVLVTSREGLHLYGETEFAVPPLQLPDLNHAESPDDIRGYEAVELFVQQARAVSTGFALTGENAASIAAICVHLDGLPLAIELAAARTRLYAPQTLLVHLSSRLQALTDGPRDLPARQKTLRDTLTWSYDLLAVGEKVLFSRLGVFAGGCTLDSAEAVCGENLTFDIAAGIESLLNKSLLRCEVGADNEMRYEMLETMREYALEKLSETGELETICTRHARYFLTVAEQAAPQLHGATQPQTLIRLETEHDNFRAALAWSLNFDDREQMSIRLIGALALFWDLHDYSSEGRAWFTAANALKYSAVRTKARADALEGVGELAYMQSDFAVTQTLCEEALAIYRELGEQSGAATTLMRLGNVATEIGDYERAPIILQEAYGIMRALGDGIGSARASAMLGWAEMRLGIYEQARSWLEKGLELYLQGDDKFGISLTCSGLGEVALRQGKIDEAVKWLEKSLVVRREIGHKWGVGASLGSLGWVALLQRDYKQATRILRDSFDLRRELNDRGGMAWCLEKMAEMAQIQGETARAAKIYGAAASMRESVASVVDPVDQPGYKEIIERIQNALGADAFQSNWKDGGNQTVEQIATFVFGGD